RRVLFRSTKLNLCNLLDGYPGHEHAIPIYPLYYDLIKTIAVSQMCVTPTLIVSYGGPFAENYWWETENPYHDPKLTILCLMKSWRPRRGVTRMAGLCRRSRSSRSMPR